MIRAISTCIGHLSLSFDSSFTSTSGYPSIFFFSSWAIFVRYQEEFYLIFIGVRCDIWTNH
jgi:hypothetical protein